MLFRLAHFLRSVGSNLRLDEGVSDLLMSEVQDLNDSFKKHNQFSKHHLHGVVHREYTPQGKHVVSYNEVDGFKSDSGILVKYQRSIRAEFRNLPGERGQNFYAISELTFGGSLRYGDILMRIGYVNDFKRERPICRINHRRVKETFFNFLFGFGTTHELVSYFTSWMMATDELTNRNQISKS